MKYLATFLVLFGVYVLLAGFALEEVLVGGAVSAGLTLLLVKYVAFKIDARFPIRLVLFVFVYLPVFVWKLILANLDVARRVISPKIPLNPGIVLIPTRLKGDFAKLTLANSITLTPGTLTIDMIDDSILVHTVDVKGKTPEENQKAISADFEALLRRIFE